MWHRIVLADSKLEGGLQSLKLLTTLSMGLLQRASTVAGQVAALQTAGIRARLKVDPVEIYSRDEDDRTVLYMNDAALKTYREFGGHEPVEAQMQDRPPDPHADDLIRGETLLLRHSRFEVER